MGSRRAGGSSIKVTIKGVKELDRALKALPGQIAKKVIRQSMRKALAPVRERVRQEAPVKSGLTRKSVKIRSAKGKKGTIRMVVRIGEGDYKGKTFYAAFVQYGTKRTPANPFMTRAFDATEASARAEAIRLIKAGALAEAAKLRRK